MQKTNNVSSKFLRFIKLIILVHLCICLFFLKNFANNENIQSSLLKYIEAHFQLRLKNQSEYELGIMDAASDGHHLAMLEVVENGVFKQSKNIPPTLVLNYIKKLNELGYIQASYYEGKMFMDGIHVVKDEFKALDIFEKITGNHAEAKKNEYILRTKNKGPSKDNPLEDTNFPLIINAAEKGSVGAMFIAGNLLMNYNDMGTEDFNLGLRWMNGAAKFGNYKAQVEMSEYYLKNSKNDAALSMHRFWKNRALLNSSDPNLMNMVLRSLESNANKNISDHTLLGLLYLNGIGPQASFEKAGAHLKIGADREDPLALFYFAQWKNLQLKNSHLETLKKCAEMGFVPAYEVLAELYESSIGLSRDFKESMFWTVKAASSGSVNAINTLGVKYAKGHYVTQDHQEAVNCYRKSAELGSSLGMCNLAEKLMGGYEGVEADLVEANKLLDTASYLGEVEAYKHLATIHSKGLGRPLDSNRAMYYFSYFAVRSPHQIKLKDLLCFSKGSHFYNPEIGIALLENEAKLGNLEAINSLYRKYFDSSSDYYDIEKGHFWLDVAMRRNHAASYDFRGRYELLYSEEPDIALAETFFVKAINLGYGHAYHSLAWLNEKQVKSQEDLSVFLDLSISGLKYGDHRCRMNMAYGLSFGFSDIKNRDIIRHTSGVKELWAILLLSMASANEGRHENIRVVFDKFKKIRFPELYYQRAKYSQAYSDYQSLPYTTEIRTAAYLGHPLAQIEYYYAHQSRSIKKLTFDRWFSRNWIRERAEKGDLTAQLCMAFYHFNPDFFGKQKEWRKVKKWLKEPCEKGIIEAKCLINLGLVFGYDDKSTLQDGVNGLKEVFKKDYIKAKIFFKSYEQEINNTAENLIKDLATKSDFETVLDNYSNNTVDEIK